MKNKDKIKSLIEKMSNHVLRLRENASGLNLSIQGNKIAVEKLKSTADGIEIAINAIRSDLNWKHICSGCEYLKKCQNESPI